MEGHLSSKNFDLVGATIFLRHGERTPMGTGRLTLGAAKAEALLSKIFDLRCKIGFARNLLIFQAT